MQHEVVAAQKSSLHGTTYDLIVCGAGSAGIAAATAAGQLGLKTALIERYGYAGGTNTASMVHSLDAVRSCRDNSRLVVGGIASELIREILSLGWRPHSDNPPETFVVHPELMKVASDRLLRKSGVDVYYYATAVGTLMNGPVLCGTEVALRDGRAEVHAAVVVDATGDAEVAFHAGAPVTVDESLQALTCWFRLANVKNSGTWRELENDAQAAMQVAHIGGRVQVFGGPWIIRLGTNEITVNATRVYANPVSPVELTRAEMDAREQVVKVVEILRRSLPALRESYLAAMSSQLHIRESRKIVGEYVLDEREVLSGAQFPDSIALGSWPIDIHPTNGYVGVHPHKEDPPEPYEIPYRCLIPQNIENLIVAGRPISTTHRAHGSTRIQGTSFATGHAAGVAAGVCIQSAEALRKLDVRRVQKVLREQGAICCVDEQRDVEAEFGQDERKLESRISGH